MLTMWLLKDAYTSDLLSDDARKMEASLADWGNSYFNVVRDIPKEKAPVFLPALFSGMGRTDKDACAITALALDIDEGGDVGVLADHLDTLIFKPMYFIYETYKSTAARRRARVVVPLAAPLYTEWQTWREIQWPALVAQLGLSNLVDTHCSNISRVYYPPLKLLEKRQPEIVIGTGTPWAPELDPVAPRPKPTPIPENWLSGSPDAALREVMKLGPAVEGDAGDAKTFRAAAIVVRDFALSDKDALTVLSAWNSQNNPPWAKWQLVRKIENAKRYAKGSRDAEVFGAGLKRG